MVTVLCQMDWFGALAVKWAQLGVCLIINAEEGLTSVALMDVATPVYLLPLNQVCISFIFIMPGISLYDTPPQVLSNQHTEFQ